MIRSPHPDLPITTPTRGIASLAFVSVISREADMIA
jgi:hypothetical protein